VAGGHGGGDTGVMNAFLAALREGAPLGEGGANALTTARASLESHLMAFASEDARQRGVMVDMAEYRRDIEAEA
jgi:hypothetical protein